MAVLDSFSRSDRDLDGDTADSGQVWDVPAGTVEIVSGTARPTAGAPSATALLPIGAHDTADLSLEISVTSGSANPAGLVFAALDNANRLGVFLGISTQRASIFKADGGTTTELANASFTIATSTTYLVRVVRTGALIDMYVDGAGPVVSHTLTGGDETQYLAVNGYTNAGIRGDTNAIFDDLAESGVAGALAGSAPLAAGALTATETRTGALAGSAHAAVGALGGAAVLPGELAGQAPASTGALAAVELRTGAVAAAAPAAVGALLAAHVAQAVLGGSAPAPRAFVWDTLGLARPLRTGTPAAAAGRRAAVPTAAAGRRAGVPTVDFET